MIMKFGGWSAAVANLIPAAVHAAQATNVILIEFADRKSAFDFFEDPDYQPLRHSRQSGSVSKFTLFPGEDIVDQMVHQ